MVLKAVLNIAFIQLTQHTNQVFSLAANNLQPIET